MRLNLLLIFCLSFVSINLISGQSDQLKAHANHDHEHDHERCGFVKTNQWMMDANPEYAEQLEHYMKVGLPTLSADKQTRSFAPIITIPIVVHIIHDGEAVGVGKNIPDAQVHAQIAVMNEDFAALNGNFSNTPARWQGVAGNPEIQFCLANIDPNGNPSTGIIRNNIAITGTSNNNNIESIKPGIRWDTDRYYNIYVVSIPGTTANGGVLGYAYLPFFGTIGSNVDGTVCDYNWFGGPGFPNSGDKTMTHETGHYLGLSHVWSDAFGNGGCANDDGISDTPNTEVASSQVNPNLNCFTGFPSGPVSCGNEHMYINYMDYVNDEGCYTSFTQGQVNVMRSVLDGTAASAGFGSRQQLVNNTSTACTVSMTNDAGISAIINPAGQVCGGGAITPQVTLANFGSNNLTSATISYTINGGAATTMNWTGNLAPNGTENVTLPPYALVTGNYTFEATTTLPNGTPDQDTSNDTKSVLASFNATSSLPLFEDFETNNWNPSAEGIFPINVDSDPFAWQLTTVASAYGSGSNSAVFDNYDGDNNSNPFNTIDAIVTSTYDFSGVSGAALTFDYAYSGYNDGAQYLGDSLFVLVSTDCGTTYTETIYTNGGVTLETKPGSTAKFSPAASEWGTETISLSAYDGVPNVTISFLNWSGWGNQLFLDNIGISETSCALTGSISGNNLLCNGVCEGTATATATGASGAVSYSWSDGQTTATAIDLCAGAYTVTISDNAGCSTTETITITEPTNALTATATGTAESSNGANDGTASASAAGGTAPYTYAWSNGMTIPNISNLPSGTYTVAITDNNNCTSSATYTVTSFTCPTINAVVSPTAVSCAGLSDGTANATVTGGATPHTYAWNDGQTGAMAVGLTAGSYSVTITDGNNCTTNLNTTITAPTPVSATASATNETAVGANDGTASVVGSGGTLPYTYAWSDGSNTASISNLAPGNYTVIVTDANGCESGMQSVSVTALSCPPLNLLLASGNVSCNGGSNGSASASFNGGSGPWTYSWDNGATTQTITGLTPGTYSVTLTDGNSCSESASVTITQPAVLTSTASATNETANASNDGTASVSVTGGVSPYTYSWNNGASTASISNLSSGSYSVVVTDANGCVTNEMVTVSGFSCVGFDATLSSNNITCFGADDGSINAAPTAGNAPYTYAWSNGATTQLNTNLGTGSYSVVITDASNCSVTRSASISEPTTLVANVMSTNETSASANDGTATASATGGTPGYTYNWSNGATGASITGLAPGTYTLEISDNNNCTASAAVTILNGSNPCSGFNTSTTTVNPSCNGGNDGSSTVTQTGGTPPFTYIWNTGATTQTITGLFAGIYTVTVTDANNCPVEMASIISEPSQMVVDVSGTNETSAGANDGTLTADVVGGTPNATIPPSYTFLWSNGGTTKTITNLGPGTYDVTVMDANNCTSQKSGVVLAGADACGGYDGSISSSDVSCFGMSNGSAQAIVSGGIAPFSYMWSDGQTTQIATGLVVGNYDVEVTDGNGCSVQLSATIAAPTAIAVSVNATNESQLGANDGTLSAMATGGTAGYTYSWSNGATTATISGLASGNYTVDVTDANGCVMSSSGTVAAGADACAGYAGSISSSDVSCFGMSDGTAQAVVNGGTAPFSYLWSNGETTQMATGLIAGNYNVEITDGNGCSVQLSATITAPTALTVNVNASNESTSGANDGTLSAIVTGGTGNYSYSWSTGATTATITNAQAGNYTVDVTDANGCVTSANGTVMIGGSSCAGFSGTTSKTDATCNNFNDGSATVNMAGGIAPYTYLWSNGQATQMAVQLPAGSYEVTVSDMNSCNSVLSVTVNEPAAIMPNVTSEDESSSGANDGQLTATPTGGIAGYTYLWSNNATTATINGLMPGAYTVTITDNAGCATIGVGAVLPAQNQCAGFVSDISVDQVTCNGLADGAAAAFVFGGVMPYSFLWSNGQTTQSVTGLGVGSHSVLITDANLCPINLNFVISEPLPVFVEVNHINESTDGAADGSATATGAGGNMPYAYEWTTGATTPTINGLIPGSYTVTITDANNCMNAQTVFINANGSNCTGFDLVTNGINVSCFNGGDGNASVSATGGQGPYSYMWSNGMTAPSITNLISGIYTVTATDVMGCFVAESIMVSQPSAIQPNMIGLDGACGLNGGAAVSPQGGFAPYSYLWSTGEVTNSISNLQAGDYSVVITDGAGCSITANTSITIDATFVTFDVQKQNASCGGIDDGMIDLTVMTGTAPYTYNWSNGMTTEDLSGLLGGNYMVTITDANGCMNNTNVIIDSPELFSVALNTINFSDDEQGKIIAIPTGGGAEPYNYIWNNGVTTALNEDLAPGTYSVTVTDANGCTVVNSTIIEDITTDVETIETLTSLAIYPNPTKSIINIEATFTTSESVNLYLMNVVGQTVWNKNVEGNSLLEIIDVNDFPAGTYLLRIGTDKGQAVEKITIVK